MGVLWEENRALSQEEMNITEFITVESDFEVQFLRAENNTDNLESILQVPKPFHISWLISRQSFQIRQYYLLAETKKSKLRPSAELLSGGLL